MVRRWGRPRFQGLLRVARGFRVRWAHKRWRRGFQSTVALVMALVVVVGLFFALHSAKALGDKSIVTQQIELVNCEVGRQPEPYHTDCTRASASQNGSDGRFGMFRWDPNAYGGDVQVYFEVVGKISTGGGTATYEFADTTANNTVLDTINITNTTTTRTRSTTNLASTLATVGDDDLVVRIYSTNSGFTNTMYAARLIIIQTFPQGQLTSTAHYIEIGSNKDINPVNTTSTLTDIEDSEYFRYDASKYNGSLKFYLAVTGSDSNVATQYVGLVDKDTGEKVPLATASFGGCTPGTNEFCWLTSTPALLSGELTAGLADGHTYKLGYRASQGTFHGITAHIIIKQSPTADIDQTDASYGQTFGITTLTSLAEQFQPSHSGYYSGFSLKIAKIGAPTDLMKVTLRSSLDGTALTDSIYLSPSKLTTTAYHNVDLFFNSPIWLSSASNSYYLQLERSGSADDTNYYAVARSSASDTLPTGTFWFNFIGPWQNSSSGVNLGDFAMRLYTIDYPSKFETYQQMANSGAVTTSTTFVTQNHYNRFKSTEDVADEFLRTKQTVYFEATLQGNTFGVVATADVYDGTTSYGSINSAQSSYELVRSSSFTPPSNTNIDVRLKSNIGGFVYLASGKLVIDVSMPPNIWKITPDKGTTSAGALLTIYGSGFRPGATVTIGGSAATEVFVVNTTTITAKAPSGSAGTADVIVTNSDASTDTATKGYTFDGGTQLLSKTTNALFSATGATLSNLSSAIPIDMGNFLWQNFTASTTGGSIGASTYYYVVTALDEAGNQTAKGPETAGITTSGATSSVALQWRVVPNAYQYKLYRTTSSGSYGSPALITTLSATASSTTDGYITYTDTAAATSAGTPPSDTTDRGLRLQSGTAPVDSAGYSNPSIVTTATVGAGAHAIQRPDGKFVVILGNSTTTNLYDPVANTMSTTGAPTLSGTAGAGSLSIQRPDGKFIVLLGGGGTGTCLYDPYASGNCTANSSTPTGVVGAGAHAIKLPDNKFLIILAGSSATANIYDPVANVFTAATNNPTSSGDGALSIPRPGGLYFVVMGNTSTASNHFDTATNTFSLSGFSMPNNVGAGAHAIQRPDGTYVIIEGNTSKNNCIYNPVTSTACTNNGSQPTANVGAGAHAIQRPDGKYLIILGGGSTTTNIYDPVANTFTAGTSAALLSANTGAGAFSLQRPDGKYLTILGGSTTTTNLYASGWNSGTASENGTVGTYTSEALHPADMGTWKYLMWQPTSDYDIQNTEVRTAKLQSGAEGLNEATWRSIGNGESIGAATGEIWAQVRLTFVRKTPSWGTGHSGSDTWRSETYENRNFPQPTIKSLNLSYSSVAINSIAPADGISAGGTPFTITGAGFEAGATVKIGGVFASSVFVVSSTTITGITPAGAPGAGRDVLVHNPVANVDVTLATSFTYHDNYNHVNKTLSTDFNLGTLSNLTSGGIKNDEAVFQWVSVDTAANVTDACGTAVSGKSLAVATCTYAGNTSINSGGIAASSNPYYYVVTALDKDGNATAKAVETAGTKIATGSAAIQLKWRPVAGAVSYKVYRTTSSGTYTSPALSGSVTVGSGGSSPVNTDITFLDVATNLSNGAPASDATSGELQFKRYTSVTNTFTSCTDLSSNTGPGAHGLKRPDGKFLIIHGNSSTTTSVYDGIGCAGSPWTAGPATTAAVGDGAQSLERPDGKFLIIHGGATTATSVYDPVGNTMTAGPTLPASVSTGSFSIKLANGNYMIFVGGSTTSRVLYNPVSNAATTLPSFTFTVTSGSYAIYRPTTGTFLLFRGGSSGTGSIYSYNPITDTATASSNYLIDSSPAAKAIGVGGHSLQLANGTFMTILGGASTVTDIVDPITAAAGTGTPVLGSAPVGTSAGGVLTGLAGVGAHSIQLPDGRWLVIHGNALTTTTLISTTGTTSAGPALATAAGTGSFSIQRADGKYMTIHAGASGSAKVSQYNSGWLTGTTGEGGTVGTYTSEALSPSDIAAGGGWDKISWTQAHQGIIQASDDTVDQIEIRTATTSGGLTGAYRKVSNGGAINPGAGEIWLQYKVTFRRSVPTWSRMDYNGANVWSGSNSVFENRDFGMPDLQSITASYNTSAAYTAISGAPTALTQYRSDNTTVLGVGEGSSEETIIFKGLMKSPAPNTSDNLVLEVEGQPIGVAFTNTPNITGTAVACSGGTQCNTTGVTGGASALGLPGASYHWQARVRGNGGAGPWNSYPVSSPNAESATDFTAITTQSLLRHGKTFIDQVLQTPCRDGVNPAPNGYIYKPGSPC